LTICKLVFSFRSQFFQSLLHFSSHAKERSTTHRLLRQVEVAIANGKTTGQACKEALITKQTYYRWRKECGGLQVVQAKRLKELEQENAKLKRLVAN
jgi:hypothetical protein